MSSDWHLSHGTYAMMSLTLFLLSTPLNLARPQPKSLEEYLTEAKGLEQHQNFAAAEKTYLAASSIFPNQPEILKRLGIVYQTEFKFAESINTFKKVLETADRKSVV